MTVRLTLVAAVRAAVIATVIAAAGIAVCPVFAAAQAAGPRAPAKRTPLASVMRPACPGGRAAFTAPSDAQRVQARALASQGGQAAILGDTAAALSRLREARTLDPSDPDLAYQLARIYESGGANDNAVDEYCRFLTLAPNASDAVDARTRVSVLARPSADPAIEGANALFGDGLRSYDAGRMPEAEMKFAAALQAQPAWADAYYDRALARLAQGDRTQAVSDLEVYLRLKPGADDRQTVSAQIDNLRRARLSPGNAFLWGVLIPGAGQFYTHQPGWGAAFLLAEGGAIGASFVTQSKLITVQQTAVDPFGNPYSYSAPGRETDRPYFLAGIATAGAIAGIGAIEAAVHANRANAGPAQRVTLFVIPSTGALGMRVAF